MKKVMVIGACGQLGTELTLSLRNLLGTDNVLAADLKDPSPLIQDGPYERLDVMDKKALNSIIKRDKVTEVYHLVAILSARGEQNPRLAWDLNMTSLLNVLETGRDQVKKIYWPSSIAVFGPDTPKVHTPQHTIMNPNTVYGISKLAGERWCEYYFRKYKVDVRSLRYPGLIGYKSQPGGGTTDYAVDIFWKAMMDTPYQCFLKADTMLPMMYMDDAVRATVELMEAPASGISIRSGYNLAGVSFTPEQVYEEIKKLKPNFEISYSPDYRQEIADSWPGSIDDSVAQNDWGWAPGYDLKKISRTMLSNLESILAAVPNNS